MITPLILTIPSLFLMITLSIIYFLKIQKNNICSIFYQIFILAGIGLGVTEIISYISIYQNGLCLLTEITYRIHYITGLLTFFFLYCYITASSENNENTTIKEYFKKSTNLLIIFFNFIAIVIFLFFPYDYYTTSNEISNVPGMPAYIILGMSTINFLSGSIIAIVKSRKNNKKLIYGIILNFLPQVGMFIIQFCLPSISFYALIVTMVVYNLYFVIENPDLKTINNLRILQQDIQKSKISKSEFLTNMSEEIKSPTTLIHNLSLKLYNEDINNGTEAKTDIEKICETSNKLLESVNNILDVSNIEAGKDRLELSEYSINDILKEVNNTMITKAQEKQIEYGVEVGENIPNLLYGDKNKIIQILNNVLSNAIKYTKVGKVSLTINYDIKKDIAELHFIINDTGIGIKKEDQENIFKLKNNKDKTSGLGLVVVKKYVDLLNGKIWFDSVPLVGTTFYIDIPQKIIDFNNVKLFIEDENKLDYYDCKGKKVLLVDDNILNVKVIKKMLEKYNLDIETTAMGLECINKIKKGIKYDLIFLDIMLPDINGVEVMKVLKKLNKIYSVPPLIALTANAMSGTKEHYLTEGFNEYISKPIDNIELNNIIKKYISCTNKDGEYVIEEITNENNTRKLYESGAVSTESRMVEIPIDNTISFNSDNTETGASIVGKIDN